MALARKDSYKSELKILTSVVGVGKLTALRLILEWGEDMATRFKSGNSLACFAGLTSRSILLVIRFERGA